MHLARSSLQLGFILARLTLRRDRDTGAGHVLYRLTRYGASRYFWHAGAGAGSQIRPRSRFHMT